MPSRPLWRPCNVTSQVKSRQSQSYKFKTKMAKIQNLEFCKKKIHTTHLLDTMCKYEMKWVRLVLYCGNYRAEMILSTDGQTDGYGETSIPSFNFVEQGIYLYTSVSSQMFMIKASFSPFFYSLGHSDCREMLCLVWRGSHSVGIWLGMLGLITT